MQDQLLDVDRLGQVVLRPGAKRPLLGLRVGHAADREHGEKGILRQPAADLLEKGESIQARHVQIHDHEVGREGIQQAQDFGGIGRPMYLGVARRLEGAHEETDDARLVVHHQHVRFSQRTVTHGALLARIDE